MIFRLFRIFYWLIELFHLLFFASFILCYLINLRINTILKMFFIINSTISKTNLILKKLDDWDEWVMIVKTMIKRNDVEIYVNLIKIESAEFIELDFFIFFTIKFDATNSIELSIDEQRDLVILREDYKKKMRKYKKRIDALKNLNIFILTSINRFNFIYLRNQKTIHQKLLILKKRLAFTNRVRKFKMIRKYKDLQRTFKHQQMNQWLLNWEKIYAKTKRLNLFDVQNYASEWFGSIRFLPPWDRTDADLIFCRIDSGSVRSDLGFYWFGTCKKSTYKDVKMHS